MEKLPKFIIYYICSYLNNNNVLGLSITCTFLREKISKYIFDNFYLDLTLIKISSVNIRRNIPQEFSNQFKKIRANFLEDVNPAITHLDLNIDRKINFSGRNNLTHLNMMSCFPQVIFICLDYLTNLSFDNRFNKPVFLKLPRLSVLTFGKSFNQQIDLNYLPNFWFSIML